jgi:hypothetical protein
MTRINKFRDWINTLSPLITAAATVALVWVTICYVNLLQKQTALHDDPILKVNPNEWSIASESSGVFMLKLCNTGVSDVRNIKVYRDCFVPIADSPLTFCRVGNYLLTPDQTVTELRSGDNAKLRIDFDNLLLDMASILSSKKGNQYRILRLRVKFDRTIDEKEFSFDQFYIIAGHGDVLLAEDQRNAMQFRPIPIQQIKHVLGSE